MGVDDAQVIMGLARVSLSLQKEKSFNKAVLVQYMNL